MSLLGGHRGPLLGCGVLVGTISYEAIRKYTGDLAAVLYLCVVAAAFVVGLPALSNRLVGVRRRWLSIASAVAILCLLAAFAVGCSLAHSGALGVGSDRDDALNLALDLLSRGEYPYAALTYLGNPVSPLPGALLIAAPFWALGDAGWQNLLWLPALLALVNGRRQREIRPFLVWIGVTFASAETMREFVIGDDLFISGVYTAAATMAVIHAAGRDRVGWLVVAAATLGCAVCSRPHFALVILVVAVFVARTHARRRGLIVGIVAAGVAAALVAPFIVAHGAMFGPLHVAAKVTGKPGLGPEIVLIAAVAVAVLALALWQLRPSWDTTMWLCAAALAVPGPLAFGYSLVVGKPDALQLALAAPALAFTAIIAARDVMEADDALPASSSRTTAG